MQWQWLRVPLGNYWASYQNKGGIDLRIKQIWEKQHNIIDISTPLAKRRKKGLGKAVLILSTVNTELITFEINILITTPPNPQKHSRVAGGWVILRAASFNVTSYLTSCGSAHGRVKSRGLFHYRPHFKKYPPSILKASDIGQFKICSITQHLNQFAHKSSDTVPWIFSCNWFIS